MRWLLSVLIVLPLLVCGRARCPEPEHLAIEDCPFPVDPELVEGQLLGWIRLEVGEKLTHTRKWYDAEGDPAEAKLISAPKGVQLINKAKVSSYTLLWTPRQPMTAAIVVQVTDKPLDAQPQSRTGTILVQVVPRGQKPGPRGCGGPPS